ncbi:MAG: AmmeMemoRadiSam system protein B [Deltaproteobacteria bacterium]|nr:AmmeMemoRadiSam system protein B [Deltaproteobacteria bacterium]
MLKPIRKPAIAGSWYPGDPVGLRREIQGFFERVKKGDISGQIIGLVVPHAGYVYSGQVAACGYRLMERKSYDTVIIAGPSHRYPFRGVSIYEGGAYETPLGLVPVDEECAAKIIEKSHTVSQALMAHQQEHSLEIQLPFLQVALGDFSFVPILMGDQDEATCEDLAAAIADAGSGRNILIVGSSDLSHFHAYERAVALDGIVLDHMRKMDARGLLRDMDQGICEACGGGPAAVAMMASRRLGADGAKVLEYANSGDVTGDRERVVGYATAVFYRSE